MPWEVTGDYIRSGHGDIGSLDGDSLRTVDISEEKGIKAIVGCPRGKFEGGKCSVGTVVQSYLFSKDKGWTTEKAKEWFKDHESLYLFCESFGFDGKNRVWGVAIHPRRIWHPEQGYEHVLERDDMVKAAPTLAGCPFGIDHLYLLYGNNRCDLSRWDDGRNGVYFEGTVDDSVAEQINRKMFRGISVELDWKKRGGRVEFVDGLAPRNYYFTALHFLTRFPPGDPDAFINLWNMKQHITILPTPAEFRQAPNPQTVKKNMSGEETNIKAELLKIAEETSAKEGQLKGIAQEQRQQVENELNALWAKRRGLEERLAEIAKAKVIQSVTPALQQMVGDEIKKQMGITPTPEFVAFLGQYPEDVQLNFKEMIASGKYTMADLSKLLEAEWSTQYINDLPDSAFAVKDDEGRHLPHHNKEGNLDKKHVAAALQAIKGARTGEVPTYAGKAKEHLCPHAKELEMESDVCGLSESTYLVEMRQTLSDLRTQLENVRGEFDAFKQTSNDRFLKFVQSVSSEIPIQHAWHSWGFGPQRLVKRLSFLIDEALKEAKAGDAE